MSEQTNAPADEWNGFQTYAQGPADAGERVELLPCPFCGCCDIAISPDEVGSGGQWVGPLFATCQSCHAEIVFDGTEAEITTVWNTRSLSPEAKPADVEAVEPSIVVALRRAECAMRAMLTGISVHNALNVDAPARRADIEGEVIAELSRATADAYRALSQRPEPSPPAAKHSTASEQVRAIAIGHALDAEDGGYPQPAPKPEAAGLVEALNRAIRFTAYSYMDPLAIRFEFASDEDRLAAANAVDEALQAITTPTAQEQEK